MQPDRSNYEIWLIDWLDGNLDKVQTEQLMAFLDKNPDIKEEADILSSSYLLSEKQLFLQKDNLKKNIADLAPSQLEYLSVAYLENDLSSDHLAELKQNLDQNKEGEKVFDLIQKIKLTPASSGYRYKSKLKKLTVGEKVIRLSVIGLSAAAAIALLILSSVFISRQTTVKSDLVTGNIITDTLKIQSSVPVISPPEYPYVDLVSEKASPELGIKTNNILASNEINNEIIKADNPDSSVLKREKPDYFISRVPLLSEVDLGTKMTNQVLIASGYPVIEPYYADDRSRLSKFFARTFREKLLKDEPTSDAPLKPYEFAKAGIDGLNKLLGWEMALKETNDESGELKSVSFNSRILKFNSPVKKVESSQ
jgi:hypothetical protein